MADAMWLSESVARRAASGCTFSVDVDRVGEDARSLRLRDEIVRRLGRPIVSEAGRANVRLVAGVTSFDSDEAFSIESHDGVTVIAGNTTAALMYGLYGWLRRRTLGGTPTDGRIVSAPDQPIRMIDHWDQIDGSVERGYAGESIFFGRPGSNVHAEFTGFPQRDETDAFRGDMDRVEAYARFLASVGINAVCLNNVNVRGLATNLIADPWLGRVAGIARVFSSFGVSTFLSVNFAAPMRIGGLGTSDPLDPAVRAWWAGVADRIYERIPDFGGFVVKADSEGEPGPFAYGRTHADGANMFAEALAPHGGTVIWRAFVYNCRQDWRDRTLDRARAAYDHFRELDGRFAKNAVLQVKFGPIDFQTREPLSPLIGGMSRTNLIVEFEITAEYLGHQIDVNYAVPQWLSMIHADTGRDDADGRPLETADYLRDVAVDPSRVGYAAVGNVGMDDNWTGHKLAQSNLYGYGRMCWDGSLSAGEIAREWTRLTFPEADGDARATIERILGTSNATYERYTAPLGVGFMVNRNGHYGPGVNDYEYDRWGTYHYADRDGVGVDRTVATGTGYTGQYSPRVAATYENLATCPDELLLFFHHVPYSHVLHDGTSVIQHIYDTHFAGAAAVDDYIAQWETLAGRIDDTAYENVRERLQRQRENAIAWRDQINTYFHRMSGVDDAHGRVIHR
ncbi:alpha-glucuronidase [Bifidobacterium amazonense]|uniref:Alpha-glucuronidase n=1 Tax=Bifidobacterium amazonense TaxID=2809027 RepID=A0ABS9VTW4_9BIFI|nr:alpha-glucuronidase [Bifidobacterium amazonense]MCH9275542.1 alpha-glucuronidase [Bifidobacterium amazonense]MCH9275583.1 alpha-glucuronidase [Bifidobacterium amazonense]